MIELLALPGWNTPPLELDALVARLTAQGYPPAVTREDAGACWLEVGALRLRGYAVIEGNELTAINFELTAPDPEPARRVVEEAALALGWEIHPDEPGDERDFEDE